MYPNFVRADKGAAVGEKIRTKKKRRERKGMGGIRGNLVGTRWNSVGTRRELGGNLVGTRWELGGNLVGIWWELGGNLQGFVMSVARSRAVVKFFQLVQKFNFAAVSRSFFGTIETRWTAEIA